MVFTNFIKLARSSEKIQFFLSSYPYLNSNSLIQFNNFFNTRFFTEDPHPSSTSRRFLSIDSGHYGLYYAIFNHDGEKKKNNYNKSQHVCLHDLAGDTHLDCIFVDEGSRFFISRVKQDVHHNILHLKGVTRDYLSTIALIKPKLSQVLCPHHKRHLSTTRIQHSVQPPKEKEQAAGKPLLENTSAELPSESIPSEPPFEATLLHSQTANIQEIFNNHSTPEELNIIYPLYQSLKRNDIKLPSIELYNIVLMSINYRSLDSEKTIEAIESKLTTLLTVYQDTLIATASKSNQCLKPNYETFSIVLKGIFEGSLDTIKLGNSYQMPQTKYNETFVKAQEYCQLGIDLLMSIKNPENLKLNDFLPSLVTILNIHPNLINKDILQIIINLRDIECKDPHYYIGLISMSKYFKFFEDLEMTNEATYGFATEVYDRYKSLAVKYDFPPSSEYEIYSVLIQSLIQNENLPLATKFLDQILLDYKYQVDSNHASKSNEPIFPSKKQVSDVVSVYLESIISLGSLQNLNKAYNLLKKFKEVPYIPELSVGLYNEMINNFIHQYNLLESEKNDQAKTSEILEIQKSFYNIIWQLYNYLAIRKDYQSLDSVNLTTLMINNKKIECRDFLLSFSVDLGDHEKVFQLIKEILLKNHLIYDLNVLKKVCSYLYHGSKVNNNQYYFDLMWNLLETQSSHYNLSSQNLNQYLSETVNFMVGNDNHSIDVLLNSLMINRAFKDFNLQSDNVYGVLTVSKLLMSYVKQNMATLDAARVFKIAQYQSYIVNEFEDTENYYLELNEDIKDFKLQLVDSFKSLITLSKTFDGFKYSHDIIDACRHFDEIKLIFNSEVSVKEIDMDYNINLSYLLNINYKIGIEKFVERFKSGYKFNESTWAIIINRNFLTEILEKNTTIKIDHFVNRILSLNFGQSSKDHLLVSLINYNIDKINVHILKTLISQHKDILANDGILVSLTKSLSLSKNRYYGELFGNNFNVLYSANNNKQWVIDYFSYLLKSDNEAAIYKIINSDTSTFIYELNLKDSKIDQKYLEIISNVFFKMNRVDEFAKIFKHYISSPHHQEILFNSNELLGVFMNYYIHSGSYKLALSKFSKISGRSSKLMNLTQFCRFMNSMIGSEGFEIKSFDTISDISYEALIAGDAKSMTEIICSNKSLVVANKEEFVNTIFHILSSAAELNNNLGTSNKTVMKVYQNFIRSLKLSHITNISTGNLQSAIKFLTNSKSGDLLSVLLNKLINEETYSLSNLINFYFLDVTINNAKHEGYKLLNALKSGFEKLNDSINLQLIDDFHAANPRLE